MGTKILVTGNLPFYNCCKIFPYPQHVTLTFQRHGLKASVVLHNIPKVETLDHDFWTNGSVT